MAVMSSVHYENDCLKSFLVNSCKKVSTFWETSLKFESIFSWPKYYTSILWFLTFSSTSEPV